MEYFRTFNGNRIFTDSEMTNKKEMIRRMMSTGLNGQQLQMRSRFHSSTEPPVWLIFDERTENPLIDIRMGPCWLEITLSHQFRHGKQQFSSSQPARSIRQAGHTSTEGADFPPYGLDTNLITMYSGC